MRDPIEVNYVPDGDDWQVAVSGRGQRREATAPGLIAARDRADQIVAELTPEEEHRTVVHLLNGDALAFTSAYLSARLARPAEPPAEEEPPAGEQTDEPAGESAGEPPAASRAVPSPTPRSPSRPAQRASSS